MDGVIDEAVTDGQPARRRFGDVAIVEARWE